MAASVPRADDDRDSGLGHFRGCTIAHPRLVEAKDELMNAIVGAETNSLVFVFGPTGVGKTTLLQKAEQVITAGLLTDLQEDRERIPVVSVEAVAPESGNFNWRDHYKRLLRQLDEPLVDYKVGRRPEGESVHAGRRFMPPPRAIAADYRYAVEQAVRHRRPVAVMIDEAQHLGKIGSGRRLLDQLDVIKSIANRTRTVHVLFGTYDLLALRNLNGQLSRRSIDVHLPRYRADVPEERQIFINIVETFERELPFPEPSNLVHYWEFLYERSLGCVGIMKQWLVRAATAAVQKGHRNLAKGDLESQALCMSQCEQLYTEIAEGELKLEERRDAVMRYRSRLGLTDHASVKATSSPASRFRFRRPGQRLPERDTVGPVGANAAAI
jgi:energy-coupling factor transporter ATP-binding protein EcfA2